MISSQKYDPMILNDHYEKNIKQYSMFNLKMNDLTENGTKIIKNKSKNELEFSERFNFYSDNMTKIAFDSVKFNYELHKIKRGDQCLFTYSVRIPELLYLPFYVSNEFINIAKPTDDGYEKENIDYLYDVCMVVPRITTSTLSTTVDTTCQSIALGVGVCCVGSMVTSSIIKTILCI